jgi:hypothetical protein
MALTPISMLIMPKTDNFPELQTFISNSKCLPGYLLGFWKLTSQGWESSPVIEYLANIHQALDLIPSTKKKILF